MSLRSILLSAFSFAFFPAFHSTFKIHHSSLGGAAAPPCLRERPAFKKADDRQQTSDDSRELLAAQEQPERPAFISAFSFQLSAFISPPPPCSPCLRERPAFHLAFSGAAAPLRSWGLGARPVFPPLFRFCPAQAKPFRLPPAPPSTPLIGVTPASLKTRRPKREENDPAGTTQPFVTWCLGGSTPSLIHHQDTKTPRMRHRWISPDF